MLNLVHRALLRRFIGPVPQDLRSMAKPATGEMVVGDLDYDRWIYGFPLAGSFRAPAAWTARRVTGKSGRFLEAFEFLRQSTTVACFEGGGKSHVMEQPVIVV